jgi:hypothetical protein
VGAFRRQGLPGDWPRPVLPPPPAGVAPGCLPGDPDHGRYHYGPHEVRGCISGPFGVYQGIYLVGHLSGYTLTHVPTGRKLATLDLAGSCKRLAGELAPLRMGWHEVDPEKVGGADAEKVNVLVRKYEREALPPGLRADHPQRHA